MPGEYKRPNSIPFTSPNSQQNVIVALEHQHTSELTDDEPIEKLESVGARGVVQPDGTIKLVFENPVANRRFGRFLGRVFKIPDLNPK